MPIPRFVYDDLAALAISVTDAQLDVLSRYLDLLLDAKMNLTAIRERDAAWRRLIVDSLTLAAGLEELPSGTKLIDIGSGGGLPGLPVAVVIPQLRVTLLEATGKKARFLEEAAGALQLANVRVVAERAETMGQMPEHREQYDIAASRAVGPMPVVLEYSLPLLKRGGRVLAMKGPKVEEELAVSGDALSILGGGDIAMIDAYPENFENELVIISVIKDHPTPKEYPRLPGTPKHSPL
ncbi:MAG: 16S rRNA (guanine(527)-N(7))-methyltransferase RsmG [Rhodospirillales bacterium]|nr:16S rRNA (guanine(527)-N(7))-methyltransferase RsmG [Rhodospirillales bacterium]